jgi:Domain of unknown function (DUF3303)
MAGRTGVLIVESNDLAAVHRWLGQWNPYLDVDLTPVVDADDVGAAFDFLVEPLHASGQAAFLLRGIHSLASPMKPRSFG